MNLNTFIPWWNDWMMPTIPLRPYIACENKTDWGKINADLRAAHDKSRSVQKPADQG